MPFLRAAQLPHKESPKTHPKPKKAIRTLEDLGVALAVKTWLYADDQATQREIALLGL